MGAMTRRGIVALPQDRKKRKYLTKEEERDLLVRYKAGDEPAGDRLVDAHYPLVIKSALKFCRNRNSIQFDDYIQEGNIGLVKALHAFDMEQSVRFATYARWWVEAQSQEFMLKNWSIVRSSVFTSGRKKIMFYMTRRKMGAWESGQDRRSIREICEEIGEQTGVAVGDVEEHWSRYYGGDIPLDAPTGRGRNEGTERMTVMDTFVDPSPLQDEIFDEVEAVALRRDGIERAMRKLNDRQRLIIEMRTLAEVPATLQELADEVGVSRERIRQIEVRAIQIMRPHLEHLRELTLA